jgi:hypothetical protein
MDRLSEDYVIENGRVCHRIEPFCGDEEQLKQIVPAELAGPLEGLLTCLSEYRSTNHTAALIGLHKHAEEIDRVCKQLWRDA